MTLNIFRNDMARVVQLYSSDRALCCTKTGTSAKVTDAISKDSSTVKMLVMNLKRIRNSTEYNNTINTHINKLINLTSSNNVKASELQRYARTTKWLLMDIFKGVRHHYNSTGGRIHPHSKASEDIAKAHKAYLIARAIQHNNSKIVSTHFELANLPTNLKNSLPDNNK